MRGQNAGGFIHDEQFGVLQKTADDLDPLAFSRREIPYQPLRIQRQAIGLRDLRDPGREGAGFWWVFHAEGDVFRHSQSFKEAEMLKHHRHARGPCRTGLFGGVGRIKKLHAPGIGPHQSVDHLDQG